MENPKIKTKATPIAFGMVMACTKRYTPFGWEYDISVCTIDGEVIRFTTVCKYLFGEKVILRPSNGSVIKANPYSTLRSGYYVPLYNKSLN